MDGLVVVIFYGSIIFCIVASVYKIILYLRYPIHLRMKTWIGGGKKAAGLAGSPAAFSSMP